MAEGHDERKVQIGCVLAEGVRDIMLNHCHALGIDSAEYMRSLILSDLKKEGLLSSRIHQPPL